MNKTVAKVCKINVQLYLTEYFYGACAKAVKHGTNKQHQLFTAGNCSK